MADRITTERVLVLGGGLAGVACALELGDNGIEVTLFDRNDYNQFQPLLYQVASSQLPAEDIARPHRTIFKDHTTVRVMTADVVAMDLATRTLTLADGTTVSGSHLVVAAGARPNFFGVPGAAEHAFPLYSVPDAERLRLHLQALLQTAMDDATPREPGEIDVVVVGGGPTGVESTGALAELMGALHKSGRLAVPGKITLVDRGHALLGQFSDKAHGYALDKLTAAGADVRLGVGITAVHPDKVELDDGTAIATRTVVWGGGESASAIANAAGPTPGRGGRLDVRPDLSVAGYPAYVRGRRRRQRPVRRRPAYAAPARLGGPTIRKMGRAEHRPGASRQAHQTLHLQGQGHHGHDRPQRRRRRGRQASPPGRGPGRLRRLARCARDAAQRRAQQGRRIPQLGLGLLRPRPCGHHRGHVDPGAAGLGQPR